VFDGPSNNRYRIVRAITLSVNRNIMDKLTNERTQASNASKRKLFILVNIDDKTIQRETDGFHQT
jgi:hypothetical protein